MMIYNTLYLFSHFFISHTDNLLIHSNFRTKLISHTDNLIYNFDFMGNKFKSKNFLTLNDII